MDKEAPFYLDDQQGRPAIPFGKFHLVGLHVQWRLDRVLAYPDDPLLDDVELARRDAKQGSGLVVHSQNDRASGGVRHGGHFVGEVGPLGCGNPGAGELHPFEFKMRGFAVSDAKGPCLCVHGLCFPPCMHSLCD